MGPLKKSEISILGFVGVDSRWYVPPKFWFGLTTSP